MRTVPEKRSRFAISSRNFSNAGRPASARGQSFVSCAGPPPTRTTFFCCADTIAAKRQVMSRSLSFMSFCILREQGTKGSSRFDEGRQAHDERRAFVTDRSAVQLDELFGDRQAEAGAAGGARAGG